MTAPTRRNRRLIEFVGAMKRGEFPNAHSLAGTLAACTRTLQRDIEHLQTKLDAPVEYDQARHGYYLTDPEWTFPLGELHGDLLYAALLGEQISLPIVPTPIRSSLEAVLRAQLAAADPEDLPPDLLRAIVFATGATVELDPDMFATIHEAWRDTRRLDILYQAEEGAAPVRRRIDIHALFLAQGAWYARVYCHLRDDWRSLALRRIRCPRLLAESFDRSPEALAQIRSGNIFDYATVRGAAVLCSPEKASLLAEREWFAGQISRPLPDGTLRLDFPEAPRPELVWWVLSYAGQIEVLSPPDLRREILEAARLLVQKHGCPR